MHWTLGTGPSRGGPGLLLTAEFCPCIVKSPEKPQMLAHIPIAFIVPSGFEWLCSCCKFGFCHQPVPSFQGHLSLGQRGCVSPRERGRAFEWLKQGSGAAATEAPREQGGLRGRAPLNQASSLFIETAFVGCALGVDEEAPHALTELSASRGGRGP